jgi:eukaryotic-like serine/threonine-protein kinase
VDVLRDDLADWYQVRIASADPSQAGVVGWVERWLIDNQSPPPAPTATSVPTVAVQVFAGAVYSAPTDAAVQCGAAFESSIYGSVESSGGKGIAGAVVRVTSADRRNSYTLTTARGGIYTVGGLGCTTWTVRLISVPKAKIQANTVTVGNLNGGRFTSAEVRFKLRS